MSSRALRRLQKQQEEEQMISSLKKDTETAATDSEEEYEAPLAKKLNAFDLLNADDDEESQDSAASVQDTPVTTAAPNGTPKPTTKSKKKKQKKSKHKRVLAAGTSGISEAAEAAELDEIDKALKELARNGQQSRDLTSHAETGNPENSAEIKSNKILSIEPKSLNALNEMKKLFGNVVLETPDSNDAGSSGRRRDRGRQMLDLGNALTGRYSPASRGKDLSGAAMRKNVLMQGKGEWPRAPSGGLGMEVVQKLSSDVTEFKLVHSTGYKDVQSQFEMCVESMDPQRMIALLQYNPYHISTLLQVSEIAKHQGDHAVSGDLLERALFNIGRSVHSAFETCLKEGKARLSFDLAENRELWLAGWRYIVNLGMKGTWRTAYEWAKLLLGLNRDDPYAIGLIIDQLALQGREYENFISLCEESEFAERWNAYPNIQCSLALAYFRLKKPEECRKQLHSAMSRYPWMFHRLAQELNIDPIPKRIWGRLPANRSQELLCELYIARLKDMWNIPEALSLLVEVADSVTVDDGEVEPVTVSRDIARHVLLSEIPAVTTHLPTEFTSGRISAADPLPPGESNEEFSLSSILPRGPRPEWLQDLIARENLETEDNEGEVPENTEGFSLFNLARGAVRIPADIMNAALQRFRGGSPSGEMMGESEDEYTETDEEIHHEEREGR